MFEDLFKLNQVYVLALIIGFAAVVGLPLAPILGAPGLATFHAVTKVIFILLDIVFFGIFAYALFKIIPYLPRFEFGKGPVRKASADLRGKYFHQKWERVVSRYAAAPSADSVRLAVIEADALVDEALRELGYPGETLAERLAPVSREEVRSLDRVWEAHRLRNDIVHRPTKGVSVEEGKKALAGYEAFLKDMHFL